MHLVSATLQQMLLFCHTLAFAFALTGVLREDVALLRARRVDADALERSCRRIAWLLVALWITGGGLIVMRIGVDLRLLGTLPKLAAKLTVVSLLTLNGWLLHRVAFPMLTRRQRARRRAATICITLGAISTVSWLYAAFVGVARVLAPMLGYVDFMALYLLGLVAGWLVALEAVRPRIERQMRRHEPQAKIEHALYATFGRAASILLDQPTRRAHRGRPWAYAHALAARIPDRMARDRDAFMTRVQPYLERAMHTTA